MIERALTQRSRLAEALQMPGGPGGEVSDGIVHRVRSSVTERERFHVIEKPGKVFAITREISLTYVSVE